MHAHGQYLVRLPRRLPVNVALYDGESFPSWVERLSASLAMPVINLLWEFGMTYSGAEGVPFYGVRMDPDQLTRTAAATGESTSNIASSLLDSYVDELPSLSTLAQTGSSRGGGVAAGAWASLRGSRYCPDCLGAAGVWQLRWRLSWSLSCQQHDRLLIDRCFACGRLPGKGGRKALPNFRELVARPGVCNNPATAIGTGDPRCGQVLAEHPLVARPTPEEREAQATLDLVMPSLSG